MISTIVAASSAIGLGSFSDKVEVYILQLLFVGSSVIGTVVGFLTLPRVNKKVAEGSGAKKQQKCTMT
jgi:hypothetical protein